MQTENDLGAGGSDFDMDSALKQMSEGLGFEVEDSAGGETALGGVELGAVDDAGINPTAADSKTAGEAPPAAAASVPEAPPAAAASVPEAPKTWRKEAVEQWEALPDAVRSEVLKREEDMFRGLETYKADANFGRSLKPALEPYLPVLQHFGIDPAQQISSLMQAHHTLALGTPQQKAELFQRLAADYGVDLDGLAAAAPVFVDPAVQALQSQVQSLQNTLTAREHGEWQAKMAAITSEIDAFAADPKNVHFDTVANDIAMMLKSGAAKTLQEAYEKAVWATPVTRQQEIARQQRDAVEKQRKEAADKARTAKRTSAAVVHAKPRSVSGTAPAGSMEDTMRETLATINARASS